MEHRLVRRGLVNLAASSVGGALKKAAKKSAGKKAAKKAPGKKAPGKKAPAKKEAGGKGPDGGSGRAYHHLQRASAVISLLEGESGGDLRMLLEEGVARYRKGGAGAAGLLRAAEHLAMAGLYAARASHRLDVEAPGAGEVEKRLDLVSVRLDGLRGKERKGFAGRLPGMAEELLGRAEAAVDQDVHLAWELGMAAEGICEGLEAGVSSGPGGRSSGFAEG